MSDISDSNAGGGRASCDQSRAVPLVRPRTRRIRTTLEAFDAVGISHTGTGRTPAEAVPKVIEVNGVKVGRVAFARNSNTGFPSRRVAIAAGGHCHQCHQRRRHGSGSGGVLHLAL